jgi:hypothetical protein
MTWEECKQEQYLWFRNFCRREYWEPYRIASRPGKERFMLTMDVIRQLLLKHNKLFDLFRGNKYGESYTDCYGQSSSDRRFRERAYDIMVHIANMMPTEERDVVRYMVGAIVKYMIEEDWTLMKKQMVVMTPEAYKAELDAAKVTDTQILTKFIEQMNMNRLQGRILSARTPRDMVESLTAEMSEVIQSGLTSFLSRSEMRHLVSLTRDKSRSLSDSEASANPTEVLRNMLAELQVRN